MSERRRSHPPSHRENLDDASPAPSESRVQPRKQFGQHFLTDPNLLNKIVRAADLEPGEVVLEIGPGLGHLTRAMLDAGARVVAVEVDRDLAPRLEQEFASRSEVTILQGDFLTAAPEEWLARAGLENFRYKVVANLPYYITSLILRRLLAAAHPPTNLVVMVQKEVAQQITSKPGQMNLLAVSVQFYGKPRVVGIVPAGAFYPRPKVDSAIVRVDLGQSPEFSMIDSRKFFEIVRAGFGVRRKQIHNALARGLKLEAAAVQARLARAGIDPRRRAETLSLDEWRQVYEQFAV